MKPLSNVGFDSLSRLVKTLIIMRIKGRPCTREISSRNLVVQIW